MTAESENTLRESQNASQAKFAEISFHDVG